MVEKVSNESNIDTGNLDKSTVPSPNSGSERWKTPKILLFDAFVGLEALAGVYSNFHALNGETLRWAYPNWDQPRPSNILEAIQTAIKTGEHAFATVPAMFQHGWTDMSNNPTFPIAAAALGIVGMRAYHMLRSGRLTLPRINRLSS